MSQKLDLGAKLDLLENKLIPSERVQKGLTITNTVVIVLGGLILLGLIIGAYVLGGVSLSRANKETYTGPAGPAGLLPRLTLTTGAYTGSIYYADKERLGVGIGITGLSGGINDASLIVGGDGGTILTGTYNMYKQVLVQQPGQSNVGWYIGTETGPGNSGNTGCRLMFGVNGGGNFRIPGFISQNAANVQMNFTGQHRCLIKGVPQYQIETLEGMIVSADQDEYLRMSGGLAIGKEAITINESLPVVNLSKKKNDGAVFGVVSSAEDDSKREDSYGVFVSTFSKEKGDVRAYINSVGEGAIWVTDRNGPIVSGDYITSSSVSGYGEKQDDDVVHNYTVAKATMSCDFTSPLVPKKVPSRDYLGKTITDSNGFIVWKELKDLNGNVIKEEKYRMRYLNNNGAIITKEEYEKNGGIRCAFIGCTYHCG